MLPHMAYFAQGGGVIMGKHREHPAGPIMTLQEVAQYLGLHVMTVYKLTRQGRVPAAKIGGQWRFKRDVLEEWLETQMHRPPRSARHPAA